VVLDLGLFTLCMKVIYWRFHVASSGRPQVTILDDLERLEGRVTEIWKVYRADVVDEGTHQGLVGK
jgi:hypothetical protein